MKLLRYLASTLLVCLPLVAAAQAGGFPDKAIRIVVPFPPGGATDAAARLVAVKMSEHWGQPVVVDNRAGAGGNVGSDLVAKAPADGYTLVMGVTGSHAINTSLYSRMPYDPVADFVAISQVAVVPNVLVVHPSVPAKNLAELVALAKKEPGKLNYASLGNGTAAHLGMEMLKAEAGVDITHVPYKGSAPAVSDLLAGQVQMMVDGLPSALPHVKAGKLRAIALTSLRRSPSLPDLPTIAESYPGFYADAWSGLFAPKGTPQPVVDKLSAEVQRILKLPEVREKLAALGAEPVGSTQAEFAAHVKKEIDKWAKVVKTSGAKVD
ncbi:LacI family transcriptional regulator [Variovorax paradoxus]|jgi:tripartite-type tricarboxylate transporter receptor subunit TctC|uniref:Bug family tripartite tricarboxylate transporter substrate binding protein n=1 Tax=Variovorax TaxID=34072 RepID=UPI0006E4BB19|nr:MULTISPECIES: tripartite tricarboxylate transporter substrate binding protein [unclassified Variovorax]KPU94408.1 LacI family transcriptional regulator [Variovorax paradoxus]KPV09770.1 LacI family transcriptional regulator [Variovorax paradoxus]KPV12635.1 LacI family transcriptional regulator [Variovorax paradoxus]KPV22195.1 LacI family transcriptional regulator [Variovorax paradoxus]KPV34532.1 LacI family transcriptional regulator [Variovorax paradoxus]